MKSKTKKAKLKQSRKYTTKKVLYIISGTLLILGLVFSVGYIKLLRYDVTMLSNEMIRNNLVRMLENIHEQGKEVILVNTTNQSLEITAANVTLPLDVVNHPGVSVQTMSEKENTTPNELVFTETSAIQQGISKLNSISIEELFKNVPYAQSCTRQVSVVLSDIANSRYSSNQEYVKAFEKTMLDGRKVIGYKSTVCTEGADNFAKYIQNINSYN